MQLQNTFSLSFWINATRAINNFSPVSRIETVSKLLDHTKIATTQIYARVIERKVSDDIFKLKQKLTKETDRKNDKLIIG